MVLGKVNSKSGKFSDGFLESIQKFRRFSKNFWHSDQKVRLIICLLYVYIGLFILFRMVHLICLTLHREIVVCWKSFIFILYLYSQYIFFTELAQSCSHKTSEQVVCLALSEAVEYASWKIGGCSPLRSLYYTVYFPSAVGYYSHSLERVFFMSITHKNFQQAKF